MRTIKLLLTYYLNISVQAANLSDCRIESKLFLPELECSTMYQAVPLQVTFCSHHTVPPTVAGCGRGCGGWGGMFPGVASSGFSGCSRVSADCSWFRVRDNLFIIITIGDGVELITTQQNWKPPSHLPCAD